MNKILIFLFIIIFIFISSCQNQKTEPSENQISEDNTYIDNKGSDTMVNLALAWAEEYQSLHPDMQISVTGGGSGTGIASLMNGTVDIANASRAIKEEEIATANENGIEPVEFIVAQDAIAIIVNPGNPIERLTLEQISDIFSGKYNNWAELGGEDRPIVRLSRETNSGTHIYFLEEVLRLGEKENKTLFSRDTLLLPSSEGITVEVRDNPNAIGYDGLGYVTADVKVIAVADLGETDYILPTIETVLDNSYPISRDLFIYTAGQPEELIKAYINWILSTEGQRIVSDLGFIPLTK
jgi:phosphate transport system substrate-binding protein